MRIAIDNRPLTSGHALRGVGAYTRELIEALHERIKRPRKASRKTSSRDESPRGKLKKLKIEVVDFGKADLTKYELIHYPYFNPFFLTLPLSKPTKIVVTIHDLIPLIYPKNYPPGLKGKLRFYLQKFLLQNVDGIITVSETSKRDIVRLLGMPAEKIKVIYEAPRRIFRKLEVRDQRLANIKKKYKLPKAFILYVGDVNYNKNIPSLITAAKLAETQLVITGKHALEIEDQGLGLPNIEGPKDWVRFLFDIPHPELAHFRDLLDECRASKNIIRPGFVPDEDLVAIYNLASVYCQPSFYEGFGLPVLEAMASGTAVVAAKTQALVEVAEGAALFADPNNPKDLAKKLNKVIKNSVIKENLVRKGLARAKDFSWSKTAKETADFYKDILEK